MFIFFGMKKMKKKIVYTILLGLTEHAYSNFPFVTSVGDRCFEEKHVFIASKMLDMRFANRNYKTKEISMI